MANAGQLQQYPCAGCGVMVNRFPSQVAGKQRIFHSVECKDAHPIPRHARPPREELESVYENCRSFREVGGIYGVSYSTVWNWMRHYGIRPHRVAAERRVAANGYVVVRPEALDGEWRLEHRVVWERAHGPIPPNCTIHHINRDRTDNRLENLELWEGGHPTGRRHNDPHCATCTCFEHRQTDEDTIRSGAMTKLQS